MTIHAPRPAIAATLAALVTAVVAIPIAGYAGCHLGATVRVSSVFEQRLAEFTDTYSYRKRAEASQAEGLVETFDLQLGYAILELRRYWPYLEGSQRVQANRFLQWIRDERIFEGDDGPLATEVRKALEDLALKKSVAAN